MSDASSKTIIATFETREAADLAVEQLVQKFGIERTDIFISASGTENSSGTTRSGADAPSANEEGRDDAHLSGEIEVSADIRSDQIVDIHRAFGDLGALRITAK